MDVPKPKSTSARQKKYFGYIAVGVSLIALFFLLPVILGKALPTIDSSKLWISPVIEGEFIGEVRTAGTLVTVEYRQITAESSGLVEKVMIKPGAIVKEDSILVVLSNPLLEQELVQTRWGIKVAEANLQALETRLVDEGLEHEFKILKSEMNYKAASAIEKVKTSLAKVNVISQLDFVTTQQETAVAKADLEMLRRRQPILEKSLQAQVAAEQAKVEQMTNKLHSIELQVDRLIVRAGMAGVLQELTIEEGERAEIGVIIARVAKPEPLLAELDVQEVEAKDISVGLKVEIDTRNGTATGKVVRIDPSVNDGNVQVDVMIEGDLPKGARPDLSVIGIIQVEYIPKTLYIDRPGSAIVDGTAQMFVINEAGTRAVKKEVRFGKASINHIQVLQNLTAGEQVIVSDTSGFQQYAQVKIN